MSTSQLFNITLDWRTAVADLPPEIQEQQTQNLYRALRQLPEVEQVERIPDPDVPDGAMGEAWLKDLLLAKVTPANLGSLLNTIRLRLPGTPINIEIEVDGRRVKIEGVHLEDVGGVLDKLVKAVKELSVE